MKFSALITIFSFTASVAGQPSQPSFMNINTPYDELNPVISPDGKTIFVTIANHPSNAGGKKDAGDIWISKLGDDNQWSSPVHAGANLNNSGYNAVAGFSADGASLFLLTHYGEGTTQARTQGISVSRYSGNGWSKPSNITIPYFQNKSAIPTGFISSNEEVFVFSAETYGTKGVDDLYFTLKDASGKWSPPKNLGSTINTQFQELSPSLSADGKTLYFSSNGRKGKGSFDVYASTRLDDSWTNWSEPINLGDPINSEGRDLFYRPYTSPVEFALYTSTINSDGYGDVKFYSKENPILTTPPVVISAPVDTMETSPTTTTSKSLRIYGKVSSAKTGEPIVARVYFDAPEEKQVIASTPATGYTVNVPVTSTYAIRIEAKGYVSILEKLDVPVEGLKVLEMNFSLQPVEVGTTVNLKNVLFEQGKTLLLPTSYPELDLVANFLQTNPNVKIDLAGHTDNRGIPTQNVKLSQARVDKVKAYLVSKGIDKKRISGKGFGGAKPIASNENEETRQLNRRVEFIIKKF